MNQRKPTITISPPMRLSGRRTSAIRPLPTKTRPRTTISAARPAGWSSWSLVRMSASDPAAAASASVHAAIRRRVLIGGGPVIFADPVRGSRQQGRKRGAGQLGLRDEPPGPAALDAPRVILPVATGGENDRRPLLQIAEAFGHLEPVDVGELDVQQNEVGMQLRDCPSRALPVLRLPDDLVSLRLEQG